MRHLTLLSIGLGILLAVGCAKEASEPASTSTVDGSKYRLTAEPQDPQEVIAARDTVEQGDEVVVVGRIGGGTNPWIDGRAAFTIVDNSLKACSDIPGDKCPRPWDYCCQTSELPTSTALVKVVDDSGQLVQADARELLNVEELSTVVVHGQAQRDDDGNLTILADGVYVKK